MRPSRRPEPWFSQRHNGDKVGHRRNLAAYGADHHLALVFYETLNNSHTTQTLHKMHMLPAIRGKFDNV